MRNFPFLKTIAVILLGIAALDLFFGNTNKPVLPAFLGNVLTQQWDVVLIGVGIVMLVFF